MPVHDCLTHGAAVTSGPALPHMMRWIIKQRGLLYPPALLKTHMTCVTTKYDTTALHKASCIRRPAQYGSICLPLFQQPKESDVCVPLLNFLHLQSWANHARFKFLLMPLPLLHPLQTVMLSWNLLHGGVLFLEYPYNVSHPRVRENKRKKNHIHTCVSGMLQAQKGGTMRLILASLL